MKKITVLVLAAGLSQRMGKHKMQLPWSNGFTIFETTIQQILAANLGEVVVVLGNQAAALRALLSASPEIFRAVKIVENPDFKTGMRSSIQAGMAVASPDAEGTMICLADMPLLIAADYVAMGQAFLEKKQQQEACIVVPFVEGKRGNPVVFSSFFNSELANLPTGSDGAKALVAAHLDCVFRLEMLASAFVLDIDSEEDYQQLRP
jgi:molybdenum cofactor cytidylyltransferase